MNTVTGHMSTARAARYAKQLTSHWASHGPTTEQGGALVQHWDDGHVLTLTPTTDRLDIAVTSVDDRDAQLFADVVAAHLERFGAREHLTVVWDRAGTPAPAPHASES